jgi:hypothetical protein
MQLDRQPRSGLATVKRDFSSNIATDIPPAALPVTAAPKRSAFSDSLRKAIQDGIASREAENVPLTPSSLAASQERSLSSGAAPPPKKRKLPSSWGDFEPSSATLQHKSSVTSAFFRPRSSTTRALPSDFLSQGLQEEPESPPDSSSQSKLARRPAAVSLSDEQNAILDLVMQGKNIFYTGSAGMSDFPSFLNSISPMQSPFVSCILLYITDSCLWGLVAWITNATYSRLRAIFEEG